MGKLVELKNRIVIARGGEKRNQEDNWSKDTKFQLQDLNKPSNLYSIVHLGNNTALLSYKFFKEIDGMLNVLITKK